MTLKVTKVEKDDPAVIRFISENIIGTAAERPPANYLEKLLIDERTYFFIAGWDDQIIGYALAYRFPSLYASAHLAYLYDIEVLTAYRRKGAGRLLMETLLTHLKMDGVGELWLGTATGNVEAQALFGSTGGIKSVETFNDFTYELA